MYLSAVRPRRAKAVRSCLERKQDTCTTGAYGSVAGCPFHWRRSSRFKSVTDLWFVPSGVLVQSAGITCVPPAQCKVFAFTAALPVEGIRSEGQAPPIAPHPTFPCPSDFFSFLSSMIWRVFLAGCPQQSSLRHGAAARLIGYLSSGSQVVRWAAHPPNIGLASGPEEGWVRDGGATMAEPTAEMP